MEINSYTQLCRIRRDFEGLAAARVLHVSLAEAAKLLSNCIAPEFDSESTRNDLHPSVPAVELQSNGLTILERFRIAHGIRPSHWAASAGITRQSFERVRDGNDPHLATIRAIVRAAPELVGRPVKVSELFDVGEHTPLPAVREVRRTVSDAQRRTLKTFPTRLDRILRGEKIIPNEFADRVGIGRQSLLRFRAGLDEPCQSTLAKIVSTLRHMTRKPYLASHLYDLGEGLTEIAA